MYARVIATIMPLAAITVTIIQLKIFISISKVYLRDANDFCTGADTRRRGMLLRGAKTGADQAEKGEDENLNNQQC